MRVRICYCFECMLPKEPLAVSDVGVHNLLIVAAAIGVVATPLVALGSPPGSTRAGLSNPTEHRFMEAPAADRLGIRLARGGAAQGVPPGTGMPRAAFAQMDSDADGSLSRQETQAMELLHERFDRADRNADGRISEDEYDAFEAAGGYTPLRPEP